jgi:hypothetical protein
MEVAGSTPNVFARHLAVKLKGEDFLRNHAIEPRFLKNQNRVAAPDAFVLQLKGKFINLNLKTKGRL